MDIEKILLSLLDHKVKFLVIGAWALPAYGYDRMTHDLDIFFQPTESNAKKLVESMVAAGYDGFQDISTETLLHKKVLARGYSYDTGTHPFVAGVDFKKAWRTRIETQIRGLRVFVPSLDAMIAMKRSAGQARDLDDLAKLEKFKERKLKKSSRKTSKQKT